MATYLGYDVLEELPNLGDGIEDALGRGYNILGGTGKRVYDPLDAYPSAVRDFEWWAEGRAAIASLRAFLDARKGRAVPFWLPTLQQDMVNTISLGAGSTSITIENIGYTDNLFPLGPQFRHLQGFIIATKLHKWRVKVTASVDNGDGTETLTIGSTTSPSAGITPLISFLRLVRLADDYTDLEWVTPNLVVARLRTIELPNEVPA